MRIEPACRRRVVWRRVIVLCAGWLHGVLGPLSAQTGHSGPLDPIEARLRARVESDPHNSAGWRMLGRELLKTGDAHGARRALERAVEIEPDSPAAQFDLGRALVAVGDPARAGIHLRRSIDLAPDSPYAQPAREQLERLPAEYRDPPGVVAAGYEIRRFDGPQTPLAAEPDRRPYFARDEPLWIRLETGALYSTNVALAPTSRELPTTAEGSFSLFAAPEMEYAFDFGGGWRAGPSLAGHFTLNEGDFNGLNLQSYRPGAYIERFIDGGGTAIVPRLHYQFTHDEFDGVTFGNRHAVTASAAARWLDGDVSVVYWTADYTDFARDGTRPSVTSADGWTNTLGLSHDFVLDERWVRVLRVGVDVQRADTEGSDFRYNSVGLNAGIYVPVADGLVLSLVGSWAYRDYFDFEFRPPRNEHVWRGSAELRKWLSECVSVAAVFNYDRFDSENPLFEADRSLSGIVLTIER
ncbi:MAG TPA: tetratricopeptide repeat protein [Planctomycetaceae bacterium]|nr:tetratricopeptide repeat protein [Planctomycetaceae bacterium]